MDFTDVTVSAAALGNPLTSAEDLSAIAQAQPSLWLAISRHPNAYPGLLDWLATYGDEQVRRSVEERKRGVASPPPPPPIPVPSPAVTPQVSQPQANPAQANPTPVNPTVANQPPASPQTNPTDESLPCVTTFENAINRWPTMFKDLNDGGDTINWMKRAIEGFAPALLENGFFLPFEEVVAAFPVFMDDNPGPPQPAGTKVKWNGKARWGMMAFTKDCLFFIREDHTSKDTDMLGMRIVLDNVTSFSQVKFGFSMISMTSAGPGYEILLSGQDLPARILFRVALDPRDGEYQFTALLQQWLGLKS